MRRVFLIFAVLLFIVPQVVFAGDGDEDITYDTDGIVTRNLGNDDRIRAMVQLPTGEVIVAGQVGSNNNITVGRFTANGSPDAAFGVTGVGYTTMPFTDADSTGYALGGVTVRDVAVDGLGRVVVSAECIIEGIPFMCTARTSSTGTPDATYNGGAMAPITIVAGPAVAGGYFDSGAGFFAFNPHFIVMSSVPLPTTAGTPTFGIAIDASNNVIIVGESRGTNALNDDDMVVVRLLAANGDYDASFSGDGIAIVDFTYAGAGSDDMARGVLIDDTGDIVVVGETQPNTGGLNLNKGAAARLNPDGSLDTAFASGLPAAPTAGAGSVVRVGAGGRLIAQYQAVDRVETFWDVVEDTTSRLIFGGLNTNGTPDEDVSLLRLNAADTALDTSFGGTGLVVTAQAGTNYILDMDIQPYDDKIVVAPVLSPATMGMYRYNVDGTLDITLDETEPNLADGTGLVTTSIGSTDEIFGVIASADGRNYVGGYTAQANNDWAIVRYGRPEINITPTDNGAADYADQFQFDFGIYDDNSNVTPGVAPQRTFTVQNVTSVNLNVTGITTPVLATTGFSVTTNTCPNPGTLGGNTQVGGGIPADSTCQYQAVTFDPTQAIFNNTPGQYTTTITLNSTDGVYQPDVLTLEALVVTEPTISKTYSQSVVAISADVTVSQTTLTYTLTNPNTIDGTAVFFTDNLPFLGTGLTLVGSSTTCPTGNVNMTPGGMSFTGGTISAGVSCDVVITLQGAVQGEYDNVANPVSDLTVTFTEPDALIDLDATGTNSQVVYTNLTSNDAGTVTVVGLPTITKAFSPTTTLDGDSSIPVNTVTLTITITNNTNPANYPGGNAATNPISTAQFTDDLNAVATGLEIAGAPTIVGGSCGAGTITGGAIGSSSFGLSGGSVTFGTPCVIEVPVVGTVAGDQNNSITNLSADVAGRVFTGTADMNSNVATLTVIGQPTITKLFAPDMIVSGSTSDMTITLTNVNTTSLNDIAFTDVMPSSDLVLVGLDIVASTCDDIPGVLINIDTVADPDQLVVNGVDLAGSASCDIVVSASSSVTGTYTNVTGTLTMVEGTGTNTATDTLTVVDMPTITKAFGSNPVLPGGTSTLSFTLTNPNTGTDLTNLNFTDQLINDFLEFNGGSIGGTCVGTINVAAGTFTDNDLLQVSGVDLLAGASCTITVDVLVDAGTTAGDYVNLTSPLGSSLGASINTATDTLAVLDAPTISKSFGTNPVLGGSSSTLSFTLTNPNTGTDLTNLSFTDQLISDFLEFDGGSIGGTCVGTINVTDGTFVDNDLLQVSGVNLLAGANCTITVDVLVDAGTTAGDYVNLTSTLTTSIGDSGNTATDTLSVLAAPTYTKVFAPDQISEGNTTTLTFTITNNATLTGQSLTNIVFTDDLPGTVGDIAYDLGSLGGTCLAAPFNANTAGSTTDLLTVSIANLNSVADGNNTCTLSVTINGVNAGVYNNVSDLTSDQGTTQAADTLTIVGRPGISKAFDVIAIQPSGTATLTLTVTNNDPSQTLTGVTFTDELPASSGLTFVTIDAAASTCDDAPFNGTMIITNGVNATLNDTVDASGITLNASANCTVVATVTSDGSAFGTFTNQTSVVTANAGAVIGSIVGTADLSVRAFPTLDKSFTPDTIPVNGVSRLSFTVTNPVDGFATLTGLGFTETLPAGVDLAAPANESTTCTNGTVNILGVASFELTGAELAAGGSCLVEVDVTSAASGVYLNTPAQVTNFTSVETGAITPTFTNAQLTVIDVPTLTKVFDADRIALGDTSIMRFTVTNPIGGANPATGVEFTETFPTGITAAAPFNGTTTCTTGVVTQTADGFTLTGVSLAENTSCVVEVVVTSTVPGVYLNTTAEVSGFTSTQTGALPIAFADAQLDVVAPPVITNVNSVVDTGDGVLSENEVSSVALTQLLVTFDQTLTNGGDTNSYSLISLGADGLDAGSTLSACPVTLIGNDTLVTIDTVNYADPTTTLSINGGVALPGGQYALVVCASLVNDLAQNLDGNADLTGGDNFILLFEVVEMPPYVINVNSNQATPDNTLSDNETTGLDITELLVSFSEPVNNADNAASFILVEAGTNGTFDTLTCAGGVQADDVAIVVDSAAYNAGTFITTLGINGGAVLSNGYYQLLVCSTIQDTDTRPLDGNEDGTGGDDFVTTFRIVNNPQVVLVDSVAPTADNQITNGEVTNAAITQLLVNFTEDVLNADVTSSYLLVSNGSNDTFDTLDCTTGLQADDVAIVIDSVSYDAGIFVATLNINGGVALAEDTYRLLVCGTVITDLSANPLDNNGDTVADDYVVDFTIDLGVVPVDPTNPDIGVFDPAISKIGLLLPGQLGIEGERLEWVVIVTNQGTGAGSNVIVSDTLRPELRVDNVETPRGVVTIAGQTVTVTFDVLQPGESIQFSIFTTVIDSTITDIDNTVCLTSNEIATPSCVVGSAIRQLPNTGESPLWHIPLTLFLAGAGSIILLVGVRWGIKSN